MDHHSFFGSEDAAGKVAGHELAAFNELVACQVNQLHVPLISLFTYGGYRVIVTCILPIDEQTLQFGSADGGRTIKGLPFVPPFDVDAALRQPIPLGLRSCTPHTKAISELLRKVCEKLNLKPHGGMERSTDQVKLMFGPTDMEVHRGRDGRYYIIGTGKRQPTCRVLRGGLSHSPLLLRHQSSIPTRAPQPGTTRHRQAETVAPLLSPAPRVRPLLRDAAELRCVLRHGRPHEGGAQRGADGRHQGAQGTQHGESVPSRKFRSYRLTSFPTSARCS